MGFGLQQKIDSKQVVNGMLGLENAVFKKTFRLSKRYGFDELSNNLIGGGSIDNGSALNVYNDELNLWDGNNFYTRIESQNKWLNKGTAVSCIIDSDSVIRNDNTYSNITSAYNGGLTCYVYTKGSDLHYTLKDYTTNTTLVFDEVLAASSTQAIVVAFRHYFVIFYSNGTDLYYKRITSTDPTTLGPAVQLITDYDPTPGLYDVVVSGDYIWIVYNDDSAGISLRRMNTLFVISLADTVDASPAANSLTIFKDDDQNLWISWFDGTDLNAAIWSYNKVELLATTTIEAATADDVVNITGTVTGTTATLVYEITDADTYNHYVRTNTLTLAGTVGTAADLIRSVGITSKAFYYNNQSYFVGLHESTLQATYFVINFLGELVGKISPSNGGNLISDVPVSEVPEITDGKFLLSSQIKITIQTEGSGTFFTNLGVNSSTLDFSSNNRFQNDQLDNLYIVGGILQNYDGIAVTEHGFNLYPENVSNTPSTSGGSIENGTRSYVVCYEWTDNLGQIYRSAPSPAVSVTNTGTDQSKNTLSIPTLRLTNKTDSRSPIRIVVYRTEDANTTYYRITSVSSPLLNDVTTDAVSYEDTVADTSIISNDTLYTTGDVVENIAPPNCSMITTFKNQVVLGGLENKLQLWISKFKQTGYGVEFSDEMLINVDPRGGDITAIANMDDKLIIFKRNSIFAVTGDGYNNTLTQNNLSEPFLITTDVGCTNINSVVLMPEGLMFDTPKGIHLITRALQPIYIGAPVEDYNDYEITSSALVVEQNHVRFTTNNDICIVYDYFFKQWSTFTNSTAEDGVVWNDKFVYLKQNGYTYLENPERFDDYGTFVSMKIVTNWFSFANLQNLQRIYRFLLLGEFISRHKLKIKARYDFNPYFTQETTLDLYNCLTEKGYVFQTKTYGESTPYGADTVYGGGFPLYQFQFNLKQQRCQTISLSIEDVQDGNVLGESFNITNLDMVIGIKGNENTLKNTKTSGLS